MARKKKTYRVSGTSAVVVNGERHAPGATFEAVPGEMGFLVEIGAVKESAEKKD